MIMWFLFWVYFCDALHLWLLWFEPYSYFNEANLIIVNDLDVYLNSVFKFLIENFFIHIRQGNYPIIFFNAFISGVGLEPVTWTYILCIYVHTCVYILHMHISYVYIYAYVCIHMYIYYSESHWFCWWHFAISVKAWKQRCG